MSSENSLSFFGAGGHSHDGANSTLIDTRRYSLFDFSLGYKGSQTRINAQSTNQNAFEEYVVRIVNQQVLQPAGITLSPDSLDGQAIRANTITARELQANTITASEIASNTITATQLTSNIVLVNNIIRSTNFDGTFHANGIINSSGTAGWAISHAGSSVFTDTIIRGVLTAGSGSSMGGWTADSARLFKQSGSNLIELVSATNPLTTSVINLVFDNFPASQRTIQQSSMKASGFSFTLNATGIPAGLGYLTRTVNLTGSGDLTMAEDNGTVNPALLSNTAVRATGITTDGFVEANSGNFNNGLPKAGNNTGYWGGAPAFGFPAWALVASYNFFNPSDGRFKDNKKPLPLGLSFIKRLEPIEYTNIYPNWFKSIENGEEVIKIETTNGVRLHSGFEAQKVKQALLDEGAGDYSFWMLADKNDSDSFQGLNYIELIAPTVQAIKEIGEKIDEIFEKINNLELRLQTLEDV